MRARPLSPSILCALVPTGSTGRSREGDAVTGPLDGIRIVDATTLFAGPLATMMLADQGADVIKIEPPGATGDLLRSLGISRGGTSATFHAVNRNKRSLVLDLRDERARAIAHRLVASADVFVHNHRPGGAARLGMDEPALRAVRNDLVYVSLSAWGETGPWARRGAFDSVVQAASGIAAGQAGPDGPPALVRGAVVDKVSGLNLCQAITAALLARARGAPGQHVHMNMLDAAVSFLWLDGMQHRFFVGNESEHENPWMRLLRSRDGWLMLSVNSQANFLGALRALDAGTLADDPRFASAEARGTRLDALFDALEEWTRGLDTATLCERLAAHDVPHAEVTALDAIERHPQVEANGTLVVADHPESGPIRQTRPVARFDATPTSIRRPAPGRGEHTDEILDELGVRSEERATLRADGVVD